MGFMKKSAGYPNRLKRSSQPPYIKPRAGKRRKKTALAVVAVALLTAGVVLIGIVVYMGNSGTGNSAGTVVQDNVEVKKVESPKIARSKKSIVTHAADSSNTEKNTDIFVPERKLQTTIETITDK